MRALILVACAVALAGCDRFPEVQAVPVASASVLCPSGGYGARTEADERTLWAAEAAYNVPANAYITLNRAGRLSAATKASVKPKLQSAAAALLSARQLYCTANTSGFYAQVAAVYTLTNQAKALLPSQ